MHLYEDQFSANHDFPRVDMPSKVLVIASTGRCGSHMLGHALYTTDSFGFPLEYAQAANLAEWKRRLGIRDFNAVLAEIQQRRTSPNGVFGIKIHYSHIKQFGGFREVMKCFPDAYYIRLSRKDVLRQAVSLSIARQTGVWISGQQPVNTEPKYSVPHINECLRTTILEDSSWRYLLAASGCRHIELDFDDVRNNLANSIRSIASFMGVTVPEEKIPKRPITKTQSDGINARWMAQFISDGDGTDELLDNTFTDPINGALLLERIKGKMSGKIKSKLKRLADT